MKPAEEIQVVRPDLCFWQTYEPAVKADLSCCARRLSVGWVLIDPIPLTFSAEEELFQEAPPIAIVLTNGNHARASAGFQKRFSLPILAHAEAAAEMGLKADQTLEDGEQILGELTVITLPGAGAGEIALQSRDILHLGDALIHLPSTGFDVLPAKYCADARELRRSLGKLLRFPCEVLTFAHGLPIVARARQRLSQLLA